MSKNVNYNPVMTAIIVVFVICLIGAVIGTVADIAKHGGPPEWKEPDRYEHISPELEKALESEAQKSGQSIYGD